MIEPQEEDDEGSITRLGQDTAWDDEAPRRTLDVVLERGWLASEVASEAYEKYQSLGSQVSFASYLLERGLLSASQVTSLDAASPTSEAPRKILPGTVFSGCTIESKLGQGGMGVVYLATRNSDASKVVVKFLAASHVRNQAWRARFLREATVARKINHPNVVKVYDLEVAGVQPHIVMELVSGVDLEDRLKEGALPPDEVTRIGRDVALGLAAAHAQGVIHRDVKPGNVRLTKAGEVKILDFGLAKAVETDDGVSLAGQVLGTPWYMAPEQWGDHMVDARTDVFALGATLYHLATGEPPYHGKRPMTIYRRSAEGKCERPSNLVDGLPPGLELAILRMLAVDRRARYASAQECAEALQAVLDAGPVRVPNVTQTSTGLLQPLVPAPIHVLGRGEDADIALPHASVSRSHARIRLGPTGYQLVDLGSSYGTFVNGMRVNDVLLKSGDVIHCGKLELRFDDGGLATASKRPSPDAAEKPQGGRLQVATLPEPFLDNLIATKDKRIVIALLERLPESSVDARVDSSLVFLRTHFKAKFAVTASNALRKKLLIRRRQAADRLFKMTFENLQDDCEAWLTWWDEHHAQHPPQLGPQRLRPRVRLRVLSDQGKTTKVLELTERMRTTLGRGPSNDVSLSDRSLSRRHATVLRLHQRLMIRDDGSRFGTKMDGKRVPSAFLGQGDQVTLGRVTLACDVQDLVANPPKTKQGLFLVDPTLFGVLCDLRHPSVATALLGFVGFSADLDWVDRQAAALHATSAEVQACAAAVREAYARNTKRGQALLLELVPALAELPPDSEASAWHEAVSKADLGVQVLPVGWFQASA